MDIVSCFSFYNKTKRAPVFQGSSVKGGQEKSDAVLFQNPPEKFNIRAMPGFQLKFLHHGRILLNEFHMPNRYQENPFRCRRPPAQTDNKYNRRDIVQYLIVVKLKEFSPLDYLILEMGTEFGFHEKLKAEISGFKLKIRKIGRLAKISVVIVVTMNIFHQSK